MPWAFQLRPHTDELLSGYLCRVALAHGASPFSFYHLHLVDSSFWARDVDRCIRPKHETNLIKNSGLSQASLKALTLEDWITTLSSSTGEGNVIPAIVPWLNAAGVFHRIRLRHALQFCPDCLRDNKTIDKRWRLSFMVICERHYRPLLDACSVCDSPFIPHLARRRAYRCHHCQADLAAAAGLKVEELKVDERILRLQSRLYPLLSNQADAEATCENPIDLRCLRELMSALLVGQRAASALAAFGIAKNQSPAGHFRLETACLADRLPVILFCSKLLFDWPYTFRFLAQHLHLTGRTFETLHDPSEWLAAEVRRLPPGQIYSPRSSQSKLERRLSILVREHPENWRSIRAELMLRATRK